VIAVDTNILVYAHRRDCVFHEAASAAVRALAEAPAPWAIPWPCLHEFLAVVTSPRIFKTPTSIDKALRQVHAWRSAPSLSLLHEAPGYWECLQDVLARSRVRGPQVHDARIAALCVFHRVRELWTADRDFSRFSSIATHNPLAQ